MAAVLIVRPWGLFGKAEAPARRTPGLTVRPWRPLTSNERLLSLLVLLAAAALPLIGGTYALTVGSEIVISHHLRCQPSLPDVGRRARVVRPCGAISASAPTVWAFLAKLAGLPMIACLLIGPLLGLFGAVIFGFFAVQLSGVYFAMLTLAFAQIVWSIAFQWVGVTGGDNGLLGIWPAAWVATPARFYVVVAGGRGLRRGRFARAGVLAIRLRIACHEGLRCCAARRSASMASASSGWPLSSPAR